MKDPKYGKEHVICNEGKGAEMMQECKDINKVIRQTTDTNTINIAQDARM